MVARVSPTTIQDTEIGHIYISHCDTGIPSSKKQKCSLSSSSVHVSSRPPLWRFRVHHDTKSAPSLSSAVCQGTNNKKSQAQIHAGVPSTHVK